jgi:hypothetical protein
MSSLVLVAMVALSVSTKLIYIYQGEIGLITNHLSQ